MAAKSTRWRIFTPAPPGYLPSNFEGFGNASLEAVYFRKPIVVNIYSIYPMDIQPKGFEVIQRDGYVTEEAVQKTLRVSDDLALRQQMVDRNFEIARRCYSHQVLKRRWGGLIQDSIACRV